MSGVSGGSGLSSSQYRAAINTVGESFQDAEDKLFELFRNGGSERDVMRAQLEYQKAQVRLQSLQEVIRNAFQTMREIVRNGMSIR